jgi:hypothetical protein
MAPIDIPHMCGQEGYEVVAVTLEGAAIRIRLRRPVSCVKVAAEGRRASPGAE